MTTDAELVLPRFVVTVADGQTDTITAPALPDALRAFYQAHADEPTVISVVRLDGVWNTPDAHTIFELAVIAMPDLPTQLAAWCIENDACVNLSVDPDGSEWAVRIDLTQHKEQLPASLATLADDEYDGAWNFAIGTLDQMNALAGDWTARQEKIHPGLVIAGP